MSDILDLTEARNRGLDLPADDTAAQHILDGEEAYLARKIGQLSGERTETFYAGIFTTSGGLGLRRYTDAIASLVDGTLTVAADQYRLVRNGSVVTHTYIHHSGYWRGPYIAVTYTPNDLDEVREALYALVDLRISPDSGEITSENLGSYSYQRGAGFKQLPTAQKRAAIVSALLPKRDQLQTIYASSRPVSPDDPVINAPEYEPYPI